MTVSCASRDYSSSSVGNFSRFVATKIQVNRSFFTLSFFRFDLLAIIL